MATRIFAYNRSVIMRYKIMEKVSSGIKYWREEHNTFRDWFIDLPAKILNGETNENENI